MKNLIYLMKYYKKLKLKKKNKMKILKIQKFKINFKNKKKK